MKYVDLTDLVSDLRPGVGVAVNKARMLAESILDRCEAVDPTEEESEWERAVTREQDEAAIAAMNRSAARADHQAWRSEVMRMGLEIREPSAYHVQVVGRGLHVDWWPSRGTTMHKQQRGPRCADAAAFVRWLRTLVA